MRRIKRSQNVAADPVNHLVVIHGFAGIKLVCESLADSTGKYHLGNQSGQKAHPGVGGIKISLVQRGSSDI